jgi:hypothetical protein
MVFQAIISLNILLEENGISHEKLILVLERHREICEQLSFQEKTVKENVGPLRDLLEQFLEFLKASKECADAVKLHRKL